MNKSLFSTAVFVLVVLGGVWFYLGRATPAPVVEQPIVPVVDTRQTYTNDKLGFSIKLPMGYTIDESYIYEELGPGKSSPGVKFTIPASVAAGTNLSSDTYISVEEIPLANIPRGVCSAAYFVDPETTVHAVLDGDVTYSVASSTGAAAGNRYEETVYALPDTSASRRTCIAVRYRIHYSVFENYPAGAVREFDKAALLAQFDTIRRMLVIAQ